MALWPLLYTNCPGVSILISSLLSKKIIIFLFFATSNSDLKPTTNYLPPFFERYIPDKKWPQILITIFGRYKLIIHLFFVVFVLSLVKTAGGRNVQILDSWAKCRLLMMSNDRAVKTKGLMNNCLTFHNKVWPIFWTVGHAFLGVKESQDGIKWCIWANNLRNKCNSFKRFPTILSFYPPPSCLFGLIDPLGHTQQQLNIE